MFQICTFQTCNESDETKDIKHKRKESMMTCERDEVGIHEYDVLEVVD